MEARIEVLSFLHVCEQVLLKECFICCQILLHYVAC